jgi:uncharacterized protein YbjT (DUF2867 family)
VVAIVVALATEVAMADPGRVAVVAGATGLVGQEVLAVLLADKAYRSVHLVGRRALQQGNPRLTQQVVDFAALPRLPKADEVYIALGTTIKVAGSKAAFRAVDFDAVVAVGRAARASGATKLGVVSAMGADGKSAVFYNQVKGEMEEALVSLGFQSLVIARPSLLVGARETLGQPVRHGERIGMVVTHMFKPLIPANYRAIQARDVAHALVQAVQSATTGTYRLLSGEMQGASRRSAAQ